MLTRLNRDMLLTRMQSENKDWDFIIIGGGATGVGVAIDAASRGYTTLLLEQNDFGKGTSSRSTKLAHGGVRYLQQGNISLVLEALRERGLLRDNAPHLVHDLAFVVPNYTWWEAGFYGFGLKVYDLMAGRHGFGQSRLLSLEKTQERIPTIETRGLIGGVIYYDGQFDDARLIINMVQTAVGLGATVLNYMDVTGLAKSDDMIRKVVVRDTESGETFELHGKVVINATGPFTDFIRKMEDPNAKPMVRPSQGIHLVLDRSFLPGDSAIMVPQTDDGRVMFAIPWHNRVVIGTTDTPIHEVTLEPRPFPEEVEFLLAHAARYLAKDPKPEDVLSVFAGIRPLVSMPSEESTSALSRDHCLHISHAGLVTITGGKWTTYRRMAEDTVNQAALLAGLEVYPCTTAHLRIHGYHVDAQRFGDLHFYGTDAPAIEEMIRTDSRYADLLHPKLPIRAGQVVWAARNEMARTVEDFLARRVRALLLDAAASIEMAPRVAAILAKELGRNKDWEESQISNYAQLARGYLVGA